MKKHVIVQSYDENWKKDFVTIRDELNTVLNGHVLGIEHVGSTSVEGLSAKPIIDIDVVIQDRTSLPSVISALKKSGISMKVIWVFRGVKHLNIAEKNI